MGSLDLCCITLGTFIAQPYGITDTCAMKETWFVVNISYNHECLTTFTSISIIRIR
jgi:hypothetical protein